MNVIICKNKQEVAKEAYKIVKDRINNRKAKVLGLPTGTTPEGLYAEMVRPRQIGCLTEIFYRRIPIFLHY